MRVSIETLKKVLLYLTEINDEKIESVEWTFEGRIIHVKSEDIEYWRNVGLGNVYFAKELLFPRFYPPNAKDDGAGASPAPVHRIVR